MEWYEGREDGLGADFLDAARDAMDRAAARPEMFPELRGFGGVRRTVLRRFPYMVVFVVHQNKLRVVALAHQKQAPGYWRPRLP